MIGAEAGQSNYDKIHGVVMMFKTVILKSFNIRFDIIKILL